MAFTLETHVHLLENVRSLSPVDYGKDHTPAHNRHTSAQRASKKDGRVLH
jgi:hypothetical protein